MTIIIGSSEVDSDRDVAGHKGGLRRWGLNLLCFRFHAHQRTRMCITRDADYYIDDGKVVLLIEVHLFIKLHRIMPLEHISY